MKITNPESKEFRPDFVVNDDYINDPNKKINIHIDDVLTLSEPGEPFFYELHNTNEPKEVLYSTQGYNFVYTEFFKQETAWLNTTGKIFGLGERVGDFWLKPGVYTIWNKDQTSPIEDGEQPGNNVYGSHPIYYFQTIDKQQFMAVMDNNVGAQDYIISQPNVKELEITSIKTSGLTEKYFFLPMNIDHIQEELAKIIGLPALVPEWVLGWHQCKYGWK